MKLIILLLAASLLLITGCTKDPSSPSPSVDNMNNGYETFEVAEVFASSCADAGCHGTSSPEHSLSLLRFSDMLKGSLNRPLDDQHHGHGSKISHDDETVYGGEAVIPFKPEESLLYRLITGAVEDEEFKMPYKRPALTQKQIESVRTWIQNGAKDFQGNVPFSSAQNKVYACSQAGDKIYVIDSEYNVVSRIVDVKFSAGINSPHNIQIKNGYYYVTLIAAGKFLKIDVNTNSVVGEVSNLVLPGMIMISSDGITAYVSKSSTAPGTYSEIYVINTQTMTKVNDLLLPVPGLPHAIALTKDGSKLFVANMSKDRITVLNTTSGDVDDEFLLSPGPTLIHEPMHIYLSPDDQYLYINCKTSSKMLIMRISTGDIIQELLIEQHPMQAAVSSDGNKIYVVSHHHGYITEITKSGESWTITSKYQNDAFHHLYGADLSPDDKFLYVTCSNSTNDFSPRYKKQGMQMPSLVCVYDTQKRDLVKILDIGSFATGITAREM